MDLQTKTLQRHYEKADLQLAKIAIALTDAEAGALCTKERPSDRTALELAEKHRDFMIALGEQLEEQAPDRWAALGGTLPGSIRNTIAELIGDRDTLRHRIDEVGLIRDSQRAELGMLRGDLEKVQAELKRAKHKYRDLANENYQLAVMASEQEGVSAQALRATARSRTEAAEVRCSVAMVDRETLMDAMDHICKVVGNTTMSEACDEDTCIAQHTVTEVHCTALNLGWDDSGQRPEQLMEHALDPRQVLWCVDSHRIQSEDRYFGPFPSFCDARARLMKLKANVGKSETADYEVRKCHRVPLELQHSSLELFRDNMEDGMELWLQNAAPDGERWADWEDCLFDSHTDKDEALASLNRVLTRWANVNFRSLVYEMPKEPES